MNNFILPEGIAIKDSEKALQAILNIARDSKIKGRAGQNNAPSVRCDVEGLTLGHFYELWDALGDDVRKAIDAVQKQLNEKI
jgi:hypothetical protein